MCIFLFISGGGEGKFHLDKRWKNENKKRSTVPFTQSNHQGHCPWVCHWKSWKAKFLWPFLWSNILSSNHFVWFLCNWGDHEGISYINVRLKVVLDCDKHRKAGGELIVEQLTITSSDAPIKHRTTRIVLGPLTKGFRAWRHICACQSWWLFFFFFWSDPPPASL